MLSRSLSVLAAAALVAGSVIMSPSDVTAAQRGNSKPRVRQIKPLRGDVVRAGDTVMIEWEFVDGSGVVLGEDDLRWCEQEIFLSLDGGQTMNRRITIRLDPRDRTQSWVVPNTPTNNAVLNFHYGCEADGFPHETPNVQKSFPFRIVPGDRKPPEISMKAAPKQIFAGEKLDLSWETNLDTGTEFDVQVSYDRGGEFVSLGKTTDSSFSWDVPADYSGSVTFRIVGATGDGRTIESPILVKGHRTVTKRR